MLDQISNISQCEHKYGSFEDWPGITKVSYSVLAFQQVVTGLHHEISFVPYCETV